MVRRDYRWEGGRGFADWDAKQQIEKRFRVPIFTFVKRACPARLDRPETVTIVKVLIILSTAIQYMYVLKI